MRARAAVVDAVRDFFRQRDFLEVDTPVAISAPAPEPHLEAPAVRLLAGDAWQQRFLQTSPELPMKRLVASGLPRIFQLAPVFRDGELSPLHRPEFRLLEWYRTQATWLTLMDDCEALVTACLAAVGKSHRHAYQGQALDLGTPFDRVSVEALFRAHAGFSILDSLDVPALRSALSAFGMTWSTDDSWDDLFHRVFLNRIEPALRRHPRAVFVTHYPAPLAALARLSPEDARVAERFELYVGGVELANAFGELTDVAEQRRRFEADRALRKTMGRADYPLDEQFFAGLAVTPPFAGIALGLERLLMILLDVADIEDVQFIRWSQS